MAGIAILRKLLLKEAAKGSGQASGILSIGDSVRKIADNKLQSYLLSAQKQGVDIDKMGENEIKYMLEMNKPKNKMKVVSQGDPEFKDIMDAMMGKKKDNVIEGKFSKFSKEVKDLEKRINSGVAATVEKMLAMEPIDAMKEANKVIGRKGQYKNLSQEDAKKILQDTEDHIFERNVDIDPEDMFADGGRIGLKSGSFLVKGAKELGKKYRGSTLEAILENPKLLGTELGYEGLMEILRMSGMMQKGGRVGFKKGMDRRTFMKIMGGLTTLPIVGKFFKGAEVAAPVTQKVMENFSTKASEAPTYFFDLMTKIKVFGKKSKVGPSDRVDEYSYTGKNGDEYTLTEDITTGDAQITKDKIGGRSYEEGSYDVIEDRTVMEYKAPKQDVDVETQKATNEAAEYEEYKVDFDQDGTEAGADAIDEMIQKEIIEEAAEEAPSIKKASGGIARMLGE